MHNTRILIAAGGTGGHVYPAIAIADALKEIHPEIDVRFVGTKNHMEWTAVPKAGYKIMNVWISGFHRRFTLKNLLFPVKLLTAIIQSLRILRQFNPHVVVSCGGYVAGPIGWVAGKKSIPLVIQEQNSFPGVTNRLLARFAEKIFTAFAEADNFLPAEKTMITGNPTRKTLATIDKETGLKAFGFDATRPVLLVMGGSGGARSINEAIQKNLEALHNDAGLQIIWQCGLRYEKALKKEIDEHQFPNLRLSAFLHNMPEAYAAADLVISRAGASSCSEFMNLGKASILVPSPNVAGDHQTQNAKAMAEAGASVLLKDDEAADTIADLVTSLINNQEQLQNMNKAAQTLARPNAASTIANEILKIANHQLN